MRLALLLSLAIITCAVVWLFSARSLLMLIDRVHTQQIASSPVTQLRFDNGVIEAANIRLDTLTTQTMPSGLTAVLGVNGRVSLTYQGKSFPCGPGRSVAAKSGLPDFRFSPDAGDSVILTTGQSALSWPTPFDMNFMTGSAPSWKRYRYCRLTWTKRSGEHLEILWRFEQGYFKPDGWRPQTIEFGSAGLLAVTINH